MQHNDYTPKAIGFNLQKRIELSDSFKLFMQQLSDILNDLEIKHSVEYTIVNEHHNNIKGAIIFHNNNENMIHVFSVLDIRYNIQKQTEMNIMLQYLKIKQMCLENLSRAYNEALDNSNLTAKQLANRYNLSIHQIKHWRHRKTGFRIPNSFPKYSDYKNNILSI